MITENDVVSACSAFLESEGYAVEQALTTHERGVDIIAMNPQTGKRLFVEAKGGTSSKPGTKRFGIPFDLGQARSHVSRAFFEAARVVSSAGGGEEAAIAVPDDENHRIWIGQIQGALETLQVSVLWVGEDGSVRWWNRVSNS